MHSSVTAGRTLEKQPPFGAPDMAKFHYTDPTRTGPDSDKVRAHCRRRAKFHYTDTDTDPTRARPDPTRTKSVHVVGYELNSTTWTRHGPDTGPTGPARTRTDFFCGETPLGPCGSPTKSGRVRVVEFSLYRVLYCCGSWSSNLSST